MSFSTLGLSQKVLSAIDAAGYSEPTPIQAQAIPHVLERKDVLGLAQTGTGKTAAFSLPILTLLERGRARARMPRSLVIAPTRELAAQVAESFETFGVNHKYTMALLIGGVSFEEQEKKLTKGADILIATPGRLLDHFERGKLLLTGVEFMVVDEADRMLDMGFMPDLERIFKLVPFTRQTLFFSATMPPEIERFVNTFLHTPERVEVARASSTSETITQVLLNAPSVAAGKRETLRKAIDGAEDLSNGIIFCNRKRDVSVVERSLKRHGYNAGCLHGDMDQRARMQTLEAFRNNELTLLVASDVAARGLDIPAVSHVFNFDVPTHAEDYVHRIGRTGRAGRTGTAITLASKADGKYVAAIEEMIGQPIPKADTTPEDQADAAEAVAEDAKPETEEKPTRRRGRRGGRKSNEAQASSETSEATPSAKTDEESSEAADKPKKSRRGERTPRQDGDEANPPKRGRGRRGNRNDDGPDDRRPFGETDYVPAFLLRPIRRSAA
ncbi:DEAD/DEAH box helicase [Ahrensia marina]|uniref:DEAD/DEAH box helicase n=1 Tax=Ahrensia marina TaxID=1514904 RepID=UPI0035CF25D1